MRSVLASRATASPGNLRPSLSHCCRALAVSGAAYHAAAGAADGGSTTPTSRGSIGSSSGSSASDPTSNLPRYLNFSTRDAFMNAASGSVSGSTGRRLRHRSLYPAEEEQLLLHQLRRRNATADEEVVPYRKEIVANGASPKIMAAMPVSIDVTAKRFCDMFCDYEMKRCKLCNETFIQWHIHTNGIPHAGREGMLMEMLRPFGGTAEEQVRRWRRQLVNTTDYGHIPALSHMDSHVRKRRVQYLLRYLIHMGVIQDTFNLLEFACNGASRNFEFERLEFIGDGVVKYVLSNVIHLVFPPQNGGTRGKLSYFQFVMDGNEGLARGYDFLEFQEFTRSTKVVSKFKSDVVETLFGELQFYLWATQLDVNTDPLPHPFTKDMYTLRALVQHTMYELAMVLFLYHVEYTLAMVQRVVRDEQLQYIRADPSLLHTQRRSGEAPRGMPAYHGGGGMGDGDDDDDLFGGSRRGGGVGGFVIPAPTVTLMKTRVPRSHAGGVGGGVNIAATFLEASNYDNYKRVVPLGGLLPRAFAPEELAVIPNYMPHVQRDVALTQRMRRAATSWAEHLDKELMEGTEQGGGKDATSHLDGKEEMAAAYLLSAAPVARGMAGPVALSVPRLKDDELIPELI